MAIRFQPKVQHLLLWPGDVRQTCCTLLKREESETREEEEEEEKMFGQNMK